MGKGRGWFGKDPPSEDPVLMSSVRRVEELEGDVTGFKEKFEELVNYLEAVHNCYRAISKDIIRMYANDQTVAKEIDVFKKVMDEVGEQIPVKMIPALKDMVVGGCDAWLVRLETAKGKQSETYDTRYKYDHYVQKVDKMREEKKQRQEGGKLETKKQVEAMERNEDKLRDATKVYEDARTVVTGEMDKMATHQLDEFNKHFLRTVQFQLAYNKQVYNACQPLTKVEKKLDDYVKNPPERQDVAELDPLSPKHKDKSKEDILGDESGEDEDGASKKAASEEEQEEEEEVKPKKKEKKKKKQDSDDAEEDAFEDRQEEKKSPKKDKKKKSKKFTSSDEEQDEEEDEPPKKSKSKSKGRSRADSAGDMGDFDDFAAPPRSRKQESAFISKPSRGGDDPFAAEFGSATADPFETPREPPKRAQAGPFGSPAGKNNPFGGMSSGGQTGGGGFSAFATPSGAFADPSLGMQAAPAFAPPSRGGGGGRDPFGQQALPAPGRSDPFAAEFGSGTADPFGAPPRRGQADPFGQPSRGSPFG